VTMLPPNVGALIHQVRVLHEEITLLTQRQIAAEIDLLSALRLAVDEGVANDSEVNEVYLLVRDHVVKGFFQRWGSIMPTPVHGYASRARHDERQRLRAIPNGPDGECFVGSRQVNPDDPMPLPGSPVAYVLYYADGRVEYVGSTGNLRNRLHSHLRDGREYTRWKAIPCADRLAAYHLEQRLIEELDPAENKAPVAIPRTSQAA